jgi:hypothetical protein
MFLFVRNDKDTTFRGKKLLQNNLNVKHKSFKIISSPSQLRIVK